MSQAPSASVRADLLQNYSELFGTKTIDGRKVNVEALVAQLTRDTRDECAALMKARHELHGRVASKQLQYDFLDPHVTVTDPDGNRATVADIRQGMLDAFFERKTPKSRGELVAGFQRTGDGPAKKTARRALRAHDYVYDVFESAEGVAA